MTRQKEYETKRGVEITFKGEEGREKEGRVSEVGYTSDEG